MSNTRIPTAITLHKSSRTLELAYGDDSVELSFEFLRVLSPSAEVRGHGPGQETLQTGKRLVEIKGIEPVGHYAIRPVFSDGHDSGIYSWELLHDFCMNRDRLWEDYLQKLEAAGFTRESGRDTPMVVKGGGCSSH
ncbi:MAG: DUF971 domain-containing protein [Burkholderiaceae bacterium]|nr:DUF971 domain-containing protein [Burkholderiaceae bacterium]